jgi:hypothetical protein
MFLHTGAVDKVVKTVGELVYVYETAHATSSRTSIRAEIQVVESTDFNLIRSGLRPLLDLIANVPHDTDISRGQAVKRGDDWFNVTRIEDEQDGQGIVASKRVVLVRISPGSRDMRS